MMPSPSALRTPARTNWSASPNAAIGPVSGLTMPIFTARGAARDDWNIHGEAIALAPAAAVSLRRLRRCGSTRRPLFNFHLSRIFVPSLALGPSCEPELRLISAALALSVLLPPCSRWISSVAVVATRNKRTDPGPSDRGTFAHTNRHASLRRYAAPQLQT